jgi:phosphoribosylformylglycinamidine synthase
VTLWEVDIFPAPGQPDLAQDQISAELDDLALGPNTALSTAHGYLIQGKLDRQEVEQLARELLSDTVVERTVVGRLGEDHLNTAAGHDGQLVHVLLKPGVMDPVAESARQAIQDYQFDVESVRTLRKYWLADIGEQAINRLCSQVLANDSIEQVVIGPLKLDQLGMGEAYEFQLQSVPLGELNDEQLEQLSQEGQLYLTLVEMQTIQDHFRTLGRDPTDVELETVAQTWSEHCSHKTLAGRIAYRDENGERIFENMLKETIFAATVKIREELGDDDWCVSVFEDNAGIVRFDDDNNVVFKVETHNHPSALEPYGGANTGIGGVIRDPLGTGLGAKPVCNTNVFCFAPPDTELDDVPPGVLHPRRVMKGVVAGVRDYGNRMGIPTVNGAVYFDPRYLGNPLVYCGNVGIIPREKSSKQTFPGDWVVTIGGRTGRDGIHGATFSSAELTSESETISGGAVQIGNAITEKMLMDVLLEARDRGLYSALTDCGAGGFSSAVGEMGEHLGVEVDLEKAPLKYSGLSYTEIWISEAQERMVLSVPEEHWEEFFELCRCEGVEATIIGRFVDSGRLLLRYEGQQVADLDMKFLHGGRPPVVREAFYQAPPATPFPIDQLEGHAGSWLTQILGSLNVASKEWVIRQYDHEVQGGSVLKPLVGINNDGPGDAAVVRPILTSRRGLVISCGMNPYYGDLDTYHMAASAIDEALRNCVAVGADPDRIAILDNFCWGYTDRAETLGTLVRAALACYDLATAMQTPFISGKDSLNNEFSYHDEEGDRQTIAIPSTLLISAMGQVDDVACCVSMDMKQAGNLVYQVGQTHDELGGSHLGLVTGSSGGRVPRVDPAVARPTLQAIHQAICQGLLRSCHDLSEGGLAVAAAEMAFAGGLGLQLDISRLSQQVGELAALFSESNSRFLCEVTPQQAEEFEATCEGLAVTLIGTVTDGGQLTVEVDGNSVLEQSLEDLKEAWQSPLRW